MKPTPGSDVFLDTNILVYAAFPSLPLHAAAVARLAELRQLHVVFWISRQILREFLAATTRPGAIDPAPPITILTQTVRDFAAGFMIAEDGSGVTAHLLDILGNRRRTRQAGPRRQHRGHHAALRNSEPAHAQHLRFYPLSTMDYRVTAGSLMFRTAGGRAGK